MEHYYNKSLNSLFLLLDEEFFIKWEDRYRDPYLSEQFYCIYDIFQKQSYVIDCDEFDEEFILVNDDNLREFSNNIMMYDIDELTLARIKLEMKKLKDESF